MTEQDGRARSEIYARLYQEKQQHSLHLLQKIDQLETEIATATDKGLRSRLERDNVVIRRQFAEHLGNEPYVEPSSSRTVKPVWLVAGVPSKKHKEAASEWMKQHGVEWDGSAPPLRYEVRKALERNENVPEGRFGLHVERTVDIKMPRAFTINLLGKAHHVVAPTRTEPKVKMRRDEFGQAFFYEDD